MDKAEHFLRVRREEALQPSVSFEVFIHLLIKAVHQTRLLEARLLRELREELGGDALDFGSEYERVITLLDAAQKHAEGNASAHGKFGSQTDGALHGFGQRSGRA